MSRSTQYIGLTDDAKAFLEKYNAKPIDSIPNVTTGMFYESVPLGVWEISGEKNFVLAYECEQCSPWSSGPMIFTFLKLVDKNETRTADVYKWVSDPLCETQYDRKKGTMWV